MVFVSACCCLCLLSSVNGISSAQVTRDKFQVKVATGNIADEVRRKYPEIKLHKDAQIYADSAEEFAKSYFEQQERNKQTVKKMTKVWKEYKKGKRSWRDGFVAAEQLNFATHKEEAKKWREEVKKFWKKYKEKLKKNKPHKLSEEIIAEQTKKAEAIKQKKELENWVPPDIHSLGYHQNGNDVIVTYQYHLEFYHLKKGQSIRKIIAPRTGDRSYKFYMKERPIQIQPYKKITFRDVIRVEPSPESANYKAILICTDPIMGYGGMTNEEEAIIMKIRPNHLRYMWRNKNADFEEFCGVIGVDGRIISKLPVKQLPPNYWIRPLSILPDGKEALLGVGIAEYGDYDIPGIMKYHELIHWKYPDRVEAVNLVEINENKIMEFCDKFQLSAIPH